MHLAGVTPSMIYWSAQGDAVRYDIASGSLASLRADLGTYAAACLWDDEADNAFEDPRAAPNPGDGYYYLVRAQSECGTGPFGFARTVTDDCP